MADTPQRARGLTLSDGVALREYLEAKMDAQRCLIDARITAVERATDLADKVLEERLTGINSRSEMNRLAIDDLKSFRDKLDGKADQKTVNVSLFFAVAGFIIGLVGLGLKLWP